MIVMFLFYINNNSSRSIKKKKIINAHHSWRAILLSVSSLELHTLSKGGTKVAATSLMWLKLIGYMGVCGIGLYQCFILHLTKDYQPLNDVC